MSTSEEIRTGSWQAYHERAAAVRGVLAALDDVPRPTLPWDGSLATVFAGRDDLLEALHAVWTRRLLGRVDLELEIGAGTLHESVETAWRATCGDLPALRALLDQYTDTEVGRRCVAAEHRLLAVAAGLATLSDPSAYSARLGAALVEAFGTRPPVGSRTRRFPWLRPLRRATTTV
jgi:hypothetical protein